MIEYILYWLMLASIVTTSTILGVLLSSVWLYSAMTSNGVDIFCILK